MWLVFLLLFLLFGIIFLKIKVEILKFFLDKNDFKLLLNIKFNIFGFWPIFTIKCNNNGIFIFKNHYFTTKRKVSIRL